MKNIITAGTAWTVPSVLPTSAEKGSNCSIACCSELRITVKAKANIRIITAATIIRDRAQAIFPERRAELHAIGAAQDVADGLDEARRGPQADQRAEPQQRPGARGQHFLDRAAQGRGDAGRQLGEEGGDGQRAILGAAEKMGHGRGEDEEREHRQQRQISKVAGVDEAIVIDPDADPFEHLQRVGPRLQLHDHVVAERRLHAGEALAPGFRDWGEMSFMA